MSADSNCAICHRTILAGERVHRYVSAEGARAVCELCVSRAERLGWRPEGREQDPVDESHERRGRLRALLRRSPRRPGAPASSPPSKSSLPAGDPAAPPRRHRPPAPAADQPSPFERTVARFNASEAGRTVAGLTRTLGQPFVSVGSSAGVPNEMRVTVAWELSWYQWGVDLGDELRPVFQIDKGSEIDQLDPPARQWNASVDDSGKLVSGAAGALNGSAG